MRRGVALQSCGSLLFAFVLAPFQHVHTHNGQASEVHSHFYALIDAHEDEFDDDGPGPHIDHADDHASAKQLDTFTLDFPPALTLFTLTRVQPVEPISTLASAPLQPVEACAHDPPVGRPSIPRAPPS